MAAYDIPCSEESPALTDGLMTLMDGKQIQLMPKAQPASTAGSPDEPSADSRLRMGQTGHCSPMGRPRPTVDESEIKPSSWEETEEEEAFLTHLFFFIAHRDKIKADSRLFLAPVPIQNGLAYTGTSGFHRPTLGVYLEWWENCTDASVIDKGGQVSFIVRLDDEPLPGKSNCTILAQDGEQHDCHSSGFENLRATFLKINRRYDACKEQGEAWSLRYVYALLRNSYGEDYNLYDVLGLAYSQKVRALTQQQEKTDRLNSKLAEMKFKARLMLHHDEFSDLCYHYKAQKYFAVSMTESLKVRKQEFKRDLKAGQISQADYEFYVSDLARRKTFLQNRLFHYGEERLAAIFPDTPCSITTLVQGMEQIQDLPKPKPKTNNEIESRNIRMEQEEVDSYIESVRARLKDLGREPDEELEEMFAYMHKGPEHVTWVKKVHRFRGAWFPINKLCPKCGNSLLQVGYVQYFQEPPMSEFYGCLESFKDLCLHCCTVTESERRIRY